MKPHRYSFDHNPSTLLPIHTQDRTRRHSDTRAPPTRTTERLNLMDDGLSAEQITELAANGAFDDDPRLRRRSPLGRGPRHGDDDEAANSNNNRHPSRLELEDERRRRPGSRRGTSRSRVHDPGPSTTSADAATSVRYVRPDPDLLRQREQREQHGSSGRHRRDDDLDDDDGASDPCDVCRRRSRSKRPSSKDRERRPPSKERKSTSGGKQKQKQVVKKPSSTTAGKQRPSQSKGASDTPPLPPIPTDHVYRISQRSSYFGVAPFSRKKLPKGARSRSGKGPFMSGALPVKDDERSSSSSFPHPTYITSEELYGPDTQAAGPSGHRRVLSDQSSSGPQIFLDDAEGSRTTRDGGASTENGPSQRHVRPASQTIYHEVSETSSEGSSDEDEDADQAWISEDEGCQVAIEASLHDAAEAAKRRNSAPPPRRPSPNTTAAELRDTSDFYLLSQDNRWTQVAGILGPERNTPNMISLGRLTRLGYHAHGIDTRRVVAYAVDFNRQDETLGSIDLWYTSLTGPADRESRKLVFQVFDADNFPWDAVLRKDPTADDVVAGPSSGGGGGGLAPSASAATDKSTMPMTFGDTSRLTDKEAARLHRRNVRRQEEIIQQEENLVRRHSRH